MFTKSMTSLSCLWCHDFLQVVILIIIPELRGSKSLNTKNLLKFVVLFQYIPRFLRVYPLYKEVTRTSGILTQTAWAGAAVNLFLYMLASHVSSYDICHFFSSDGIFQSFQFLKPTFLSTRFKYDWSLL